METGFWLVSSLLGESQQGENLVSLDEWIDKWKSVKEKRALRRRDAIEALFEVEVILEQAISPLEGRRKRQFAFDNPLQYI
jgi:hypothetical protein